MQDSIFTKIIKGEIPAEKIYEDEHTLAFLDIYPDEEGHTLIVPKKQIDRIYDLDDDDYTHLWSVAKRIARHYEDTLGRRVIFKVIGVDVPHAHIHVIPYDPQNHTQHTEHMEEKMAQEPDFAALATIASKLRIS
ncbi:HIT domain-containing protein [Candidatus Saccharibacteria bacterium]|nr:HIT domain-containing protein [Candidatus Saccharibacteria bacterium]